MALETETPQTESNTRLSASVSNSLQNEDGEGELEAGEDAEAENEKEEIEQLLPNTNIVTHCIYRNDPKRLIQCFEDDADPYKEEVLEYLNERDDDGKSPLDLAACLGRIELTKELIQRGAEINNFTQKGYSCLHYAASWGRLPVLKILIENGGDLQQRNTHGERPREAAMRYQQVESVDYLDWAEAKAMLQDSIKQTLETFTDVDKAVAGRITKEEKALTMNTCKEKQEWLDNTADATTQDFISQRTALHEIVNPILQKLSEPPPEGQEKREVKK